MSAAKIKFVDVTAEHTAEIVVKIREGDRTGASQLWDALAARIADMKSYEAMMLIQRIRGEADKAPSTPPGVAGG